MKYEIECDCVEERTPRVIPVLKETLKDNHEIYVLLCDRCFEDHKEVMRCEFSEEQFENKRIREFYNLENISDGVKSDKDLELNENKADDSNETETKQNQEEEKKVSNEEKVDDNLKSEEPKKT